MAIGNQLELGVVLHGFGRANEALGVLKQTFGSLKQAQIDFKTNMDTASDAMKRANEANEKSTSSLNNLSGATASVDETMRDFAQTGAMATQSYERLRQVVFEATGALATFASQGLLQIASGFKESAIEMESLMIQLRSIQTASEDTTESLNKLVEVSKLPGVTFESAIKGVTQLRATGVSAELATSSIVELGNALSSVGADPSELSGVVRAFSQIQSKGKVYAEEIYQIAERLPQIRKIMLDVIGTADTELLAKEGYSAKQFLTLVTEGLSKLPRVAENTRNNLANLRQEVKLLQNEFGKHLLPTFNSIVKGLTNFLISLKELPESTKQAVAWFVQFGGIIFGSIGVLASLSQILGIGSRSMAQLGLSLTKTSGATAGMTASQIGLQSAMATTTRTARVLTIAMSALKLVAIVSFVAGVAGLVWSIWKWRNANKEVKDSFTDLNDEINNTKEVIATFTEVDQLTNSLMSHMSAVESVTEKYGDLKTAIEATGKSGADSILNQDKGEANIELQTAKIMSLLAKDAELYNKVVGTVEGKYGLKITEIVTGEAGTKTVEKIVETTQDLIKWRKHYKGVLLEYAEKESQEQSKSLAVISKQYDDLAKGKTDTRGGVLVIQDAMKELPSLTRNLSKRINNAVADSVYENLQSVMFGLESDDLIDAQVKFNKKGFAQGSLLDIKSEYEKALGDKGDDLFAVAGTQIKGTLQDSLGLITRKHKEVLVAGSKAIVAVHQELRNVSLLPEKGWGEIKDIRFGNVWKQLQGEEKKSWQEVPLALATRGQANLNNILSGILNWKSANAQYATDTSKAILAGIPKGDLITDDQLQTVIGQKTFKLYSEIEKQINTRVKEVNTELLNLNKQMQKAVDDIYGYQSLVRQLTGLGEKETLVTVVINGIVANLEAQKIAEDESLLGIKATIMKMTGSGEDAKDKRNTFAKTLGLDTTQADYNVQDLLDRATIQNSDSLRQLDATITSYNSILELATGGLRELAIMFVDKKDGYTMAEKFQLAEKYFELFTEGENENRKFVETKVEEYNKTMKESGENFKRTLTIARGEGKTALTMEIDRQDSFKDVATPLMAYFNAIQGYEGGIKDLLAKQNISWEETINLISKNKDFLEKAFVDQARALSDVRARIDILPDSYAKTVQIALLDKAEREAEYKRQIELLEIDTTDESDREVKRLTAQFTTQEDVYNKRIANIKEEFRLNEQKFKQQKMSLDYEISQLKKINDMKKSTPTDELSYQQSLFNIEKQREQNRLKGKQLLSEYSVALNNIENLKKEGDTDGLLQYENETLDVINEKIALLWESLSVESKRADIIKVITQVETLGFLTTLRRKDLEQDLIDATKIKLNLLTEGLDITEIERKRQKSLTEDLKERISISKTAMNKNIINLRLQGNTSKNALKILKQEHVLKNEDRRLESEQLSKRISDHNSILQLQNEINNIKGTDEEFALSGLEEQLKNIINSGGVLDNNIDDIVTRFHELGRQGELAGLQLDLAIKQLNWKKEEESFTRYMKTIETGLHRVNAITTEFSRARQFEGETGLSSQVLGLDIFDDKMINEMKDKYNSFYKTGADPQTITDLANFNTELEAITKEKEAIGNMGVENEEQKQQKIQAVLQKELDLYMKFNQDYRKFLDELKNLSDERFNNAMDYITRMDKMGEEEEMMDIDKKYSSNRKISSQQQNNMEKEKIQVRMKYTMLGHKNQLLQLQKQRGEIARDDTQASKDAFKRNDQEQILLRRRTRLDLTKQLQNIDKYNKKAGGQEGKNQNTLGSTVLKWQSQSVKNRKAYHNNVQTAEEDHLAEMNKLANLTGKTEEQKAQQHIATQLQMIEDRKKLNKEFAKEQADNYQDLMKTLKGSRSPKVGEKIEIPEEYLNLINSLEDINTEIERPLAKKDHILSFYKKQRKLPTQEQGGFWSNLFGGKKQAKEQFAPPEFDSKKFLSGTNRGLVDAMMENLGAVTFGRKFGITWAKEAEAVLGMQKKHKWMSDGTFGDREIRDLDQATFSQDGLQNLATTLADFMDLGMTGEMFAQEFTTKGVKLSNMAQMTKEAEANLTKVQADARKAEADRKIKEAEYLSKINASLKSLSDGESSTLNIFERSIMKVTAKLNELANSASFRPSSGGWQAPPVNLDITVTGGFSANQLGYFSFQAQQKGAEQGILPSTTSVDYWNNNRHQRRTMFNVDQPGSLGNNAYPLSSPVSESGMTSTGTQNATWLNVPGTTRTLPKPTTTTPVGTDDS